MKKLKKSVAIMFFALGFGSAKSLDFFESSRSPAFFPSLVEVFNASEPRSLKSNKPEAGNINNEHRQIKQNEIKGNSVCFTPPSGCAGLIVQIIEKARKNIFLQAYGFSHPEIAKAIVEAKQRGVEVKVLLDRSNLSQSYSKMKELLKAGIEVKIDKISGIAHNKIMILDEKIVITGSFNFTKNADSSNAENVLIIESKDIAQKYLNNWLLRAAKSVSAVN